MFAHGDTLFIQMWIKLEFVYSCITSMVFFFYQQVYEFIYSYTLISHFIKNIILILGMTPLSSQNSLNSSWYGGDSEILVHFEMIASHNHSRFFSAAHSCCESPIIPHSRGVLLDSGLMTDHHGSSLRWLFESFGTWPIIMLELAVVRWLWPWRDAQWSATIL